MANDLHGAIMNIPCNPGERPPTYALAYKLGHRDARHAAAELALTSPVAPEQVVAAEQVPMTLDQFFAEARRTGLTADVFAAQLAGRPEFADCLPEAAPAAMEGTPKKTDAEAYIELAESMGYPGGDACGLSPEEWAADLLRDAKLNRTAATPAAPSAVMDERAGFEVWADDQGFVLQRVVQGDDYQDLRTQGPWDAWQARAALAQPAPVQATTVGTEDCRSCEGTGSGGMGSGCTDCLGSGIEPNSCAYPNCTCDPDSWNAPACAMRNSAAAPVQAGAQQAVAWADPASLEAFKREDYIGAESGWMYAKPTSPTDVPLYLAAPTQAGAGDAKGGA